MSGGRHRRRSGRRLAGPVAALAVAAVALIGFQVPGASGAFTAKVANTGAAASNPYFTCTGAVSDTVAGRAYFAYPLADTGLLGLLPANDVSGNSRDGNYTLLGVSYSQSSAVCARDTPIRSVTLNGATGYISGPTGTTSGPNVFSEEIWFKTTVAGGKLIGFGNQRTGKSSVYDRHLYIDSTGRLVFGVYPTAVRTISSPAVVNDGAWHQAVATLSPAGMTLYLDGKQVASDAGVTTGESVTGYWRIGYDNLDGWTNPPANYYFTGSLAWASVYTYPLSAAQVAQHYAAGR